MSSPVLNDGVYRIKVATRPKYMELVTRAGVTFVIISDLKPGDIAQEWKIVKDGTDFKIESSQGQAIGWEKSSTRKYWERGYLLPKPSPEFKWKFEQKSAEAYRIIPTNLERSFVDVCDTESVHFWLDNPSGVNQNWAFEFVRPLTSDPGTKLPPAVPSDQKSFQDEFFPLTPADAAKEQYDLVIVGTGIGGGILANDLYDTSFKVANRPKRILLLEKGGLVFHTHCLNTARPAGLVKDRGQQNDTFFDRFKRNFVFNSPPKKEDWKGGPMYNLGGRSAAWGLFAPRIHDDVLQETFTPKVIKELKEEYYDKAELLMNLSLPNTKRAHQHVIDLLNMGAQSLNKVEDVQWQWGRIASEFQESRNFDFAQGAYSTIDKILEIAMSRPTQGDRVVEHSNFKTVLNADVRSLSFDSSNAVTAVNVRRSKDETPVPIRLAKGGQVVLCAGSVDSPGILLRSSTPSLNFGSLLTEYKGLHLTDHPILAYTCPFRYSNPGDREAIGAMKLQTYARFGGEVALVNMSIDASSFLPRARSPDDSLPKLIIVFMLQQPLVESSSIDLDPDTKEPRVKMGRRGNLKAGRYELFQDMTVASMKAIQSAAKVKFVGFEEKEITPSDIKFTTLPWGAVAHELGTLPTMVQQDSTSKDYCLDENLSIRPEICKGVYVCDLSVFPHSPEANPTLTLAALAIRLSRHLLPRVNKEKVPSNQVRVVNHSGAKVKVWLSNYTHHKDDPCYNPKVSGPCQPLTTWATGSVQREPWKHMEPGTEESWDRAPEIPQSLMVFKLDHSKDKPDTFLTEPLLLSAHAGRVTPILYF